MKLRYMIEHALRDRIRDPRYEPVGVWVQGSGPGLDLVIEFLPGNTDAREEADWIINAWWKTTSGLCPRIFWPTIRPRSQLTEACAAPSSKPTNSLRQTPARGSSWTRSHPAESPDPLRHFQTGSGRYHSDRALRPSRGLRSADGTSAPPA